MPTKAQQPRAAGRAAAGEAQSPPAPPPFDRRIRIPRLQAFGVSLLALIPLAALGGFVGVGTGQASATAQGLELRVEYPDLLRYRISRPLEVTVANTGAGPVVGLVVRVDGTWLSGFSDARFSPPPARITDRAYEVALADLPAGETRRVVVHLQAEAYGRHRGRITATSADGAAVGVDLATLILP